MAIIWRKEREQMTNEVASADHSRTTEWPSVNEIAAMPDYKFDFYRKLMGDAFPTAEQFEANNAAAKAAALGQEERRWVYFVKAETGPIKIGIAFDIKKRLASLRGSSPVSLDLVAQVRGGRCAEAEYHERFAAHRLHGEWFKPHEDILAEIARLTPQDKE